MVDDLLHAGLTDSDLPRIEEAFRRWGPHATRWPRCADILTHLPRRSEIPSDTLLEHKPDPEGQRKVAAMLRDLKLKVVK